MSPLPIDHLVVGLLIVLAAGLVSGMICRWLGVSLLVGYLLIGAVVGQGVLGFVSQENHELEYLAEAGALLLLFAVGIEFSIEELVRLSRFFLVGGAVQMLAVGIPLAVACWWLGMAWQPAVLMGAAGSLSSTILVFKALNEWGQTATPHGRRAIGILLFQDVALVPLMLVIPMLTGSEEQSTWQDFAILLVMALSLVLAVHVLRHMIASYVVPFLADLRSVELVVLFSVLVLAGMCWAADRMGLPAAIGALAAGLMLSGNRMTKQIDTLVLPFRESFSAVFFVTLGTLLDPSTFLREPVLLLSCLIGVIGLKSLAAMLALRVTGLSWRASAGMGVGLSQLGEFSFLLISIGVAQGIVSATDYNRVLFIAMGTLVLTPQLIKRGLTWTDGEELDADPSMVGLRAATYAQHAIVIGAGLIGRKTAARLETLGVDVCLIDQSPINLYPFAQQGFLTVTGDAVDPDVLSRAFAKTCKLCVVCVPDDRIASQIVTTLRRTNPSMFILVRCRYFTNVASLISSGADTAISEEQEASAAILRVCERILWQQNREDELPPSTG